MCREARPCAGAETWSGVSQQVPSDLARLRRGGLSQLLSQGVHGGRALRRPRAPVGGTRAVRALPRGQPRAQPGLLEVPFGCPSGGWRVPALLASLERQQYRLWGQALSLHGSWQLCGLSGFLPLSLNKNDKAVNQRT